MSSGEIKIPASGIPKIRVAKKQDMEWINH